LKRLKLLLAEWFNQHKNRSISSPQICIVSDAMSRILFLIH
jgi:hypothetical protein